MKKGFGLILLAVMICLCLVCVPESDVYAAEEEDIQKTGWIQDGDDWFYLNKDGSRQTGWKKIKEKWYYFLEDGKMVTGWQTISGRRYYFGRNGIMKTGWLKSNKAWYYLSEKTGKKTGWVQDEGEWYYLDTATGKMLTDRIICSMGVYYYLDKNGCSREIEDQLAAGKAITFKGDLHKAMEYASYLNYYGRDIFGESWTSQQLAEYGITNGRGNCYVKAATFREIAVAMGYEAHQVYGFVATVNGPARHSWVELVIDGETWCCDPSGATAFGIKLAYMFKYGTKGTYIYSDIKYLS